MPPAKYSRVALLVAIFNRVYINYFRGQCPYCRVTELFFGKMRGAHRGRERGGNVLGDGRERRGRETHQK
jgi:hypothetical protein